MTIAELYPKHFEEIRRFVRSMCSNVALAEDVVQETFLRALGSSEEIAALSEAKARAWLYTTSRRIFIDHYRREKNRPVMAAPEAHQDDLSVVVVCGLLSALSGADREIFVLRHFSGFNSVEIGLRLNIPAATVRTRLRAASRTLRKIYRQTGGQQNG